MLQKINELIVAINTITCRVKNVQEYLGTIASKDPSTITGRLNELEKLVKHNNWPSVSEWRGVDEWSEKQTNHTAEEW